MVSPSRGQVLHRQASQPATDGGLHQTSHTGPVRMPSSGTPIDIITLGDEEDWVERPERLAA